MDENEMMHLADLINRHLDSEKVFIENTPRLNDVNTAREIAKTLFRDAEITIKGDALQTGGMVLSLTDYSFTITGKRETDLFHRLVCKANNFEIYSVGKEKTRIDLMFCNAYNFIGTNEKSKE